jgi:ABC-2 type transport system ATP-binding protein
MSIAIEFSNLSKSFGRGKNQVQAVKNINLQIESGQVYGFLGPNGAGKSTTIRMMLDLIRPTTGHTQVFGKDTATEHEVLRRFGSMVEGATFYPFMSGRKNLEVLARTSGHIDKQRIEILLEQVGLIERAKQNVDAYSMGMKQRLGLAAALLDDPELVVLDEPTNGLDPSGIREMRTFIRELVGEQGKTVFLSSHLLSEVEQVCDRVAIINHGQIIREGTVANLLDNKAQLHIEAKPIDKTLEILNTRWQAQLNGKGLIATAPYEETPQIVNALVEQGIEIYRIASEHQSLEEYFLEVIEEE